MKQVLVAEDDAFVRELIESALGSLTCTVLSVSDGAAVMEILETKPVDALILDVDLPHVDGLTLLKLIKADTRFALLPVLVFTNQDDTALRAVVLELGGHYYFKAVTDMNQLRTDIEKLLA